MLKFKLKGTNSALEILLEYGMRYPCQSLKIDKYCLHNQCQIIFLWIQIIEHEIFLFAFIWL